MTSDSLIKILTGLFFVAVYVRAIYIIKDGYKNPGNWTHNLRHYPYGTAVMIVFLLPQFGLLSLVRYMPSGFPQLIILTVLGLGVLITTTTLSLDFIHKKRLFKNDR